MERNTTVVFIAKTVRTFCYGFLVVRLPVYLSDLGMSAKELGLAFTAMLLAIAAMTWLVRRPSEFFGPRPVLMALSLLMCVSASMLLVFHHSWLVVLAAMMGNVAVNAGDTGPFLSLEQVLLSRCAPKDRLTSIMSFYNLAGYVAAAAGAAVAGQSAFSARGLFWIFLAAGLVHLPVYALLPSESSAMPGSDEKPARLSGPLVRRLAALFALDSFAGGFVIQSFVVYWFYIHFQMDLEKLGWIFSGTQLVTGFSFLMAPPLSRRFGLVQTMVFCHLISNALLIAIGFSPTPALAIFFLFGRSLLSQIDVPTRQTFLMLAVEDAERESAASLTNMSRTLAQAVSPAMTGWIIHMATLSAPFLLGGVLKCVYDLMLYATIRHIPAGRGKI